MSPHQSFSYQHLQYADCQTEPIRLFCSSRAGVLSQAQSIACLLVEPDYSSYLRQLSLLQSTFCYASDSSSLLLSLQMLLVQQAIVGPYFSPLTGSGLCSSVNSQSSLPQSAECHHYPGRRRTGASHSSRFQPRLKSLVIDETCSSTFYCHGYCVSRSASQTGRVHQIRIVYFEQYSSIFASYLSICWPRDLTYSRRVAAYARSGCCFGSWRRGMRWPSVHSIRSYSWVSH